MTDTETTWLVVAGILALAVLLFVGYLVTSTARSRPAQGGRHRAPRRKRPHRDTFRTEEPEPEPLKRAAVIAQGADRALRAELSSHSVSVGWDAPLWVDADDLAAAAAGARLALEAGVDVVCVRGDSSIARGVVEVLAGTETPVAFLPDPPSLERTAAEGEEGQAPPPHTPVALAAAMTTALTGQNARVDVGRARLARKAPHAGEGTRESADPLAWDDVVFLHALVLGDVVSHEGPALSTRTVARGLVKGTSFTATVKPDDEEAVTRPARSVAFSTEAGATGGRLDAYLHASHSLKGWTGVARAMMRKSSRPTPLLVPLRSSAFTVTVDEPVRLTVDGLDVGECGPGESTVAVDPLALVVRR